MSKHYVNDRIKYGALMLLRGWKAEFDTQAVKGESPYKWTSPRGVVYRTYSINDPGDDAVEDAISRKDIEI